MTASLLLLAAALAIQPADRGAPSAYTGARAEGRVAVRIVAGARIAASETEQASLPPLSDSVIRAPDGSLSAARLVEFQ